MQGVCSHKPKSIKAPCSGSIEQSSGEKLDKINAFDFLMCFELRPRAQLVFLGIALGCVQGNSSAAWNNLWSC